MGHTIVSLSGPSCSDRWDLSSVSVLTRTRILKSKLSKICLYGFQKQRRAHLITMGWGQGNMDQMKEKIQKRNRERKTWCEDRSVGLDQFLARSQEAAANKLMVLEVHLWKKYWVFITGGVLKLLRSHHSNFKTFIGRRPANWGLKFILDKSIYL